MSKSSKRRLLKAALIVFAGLVALVLLVGAIYWHEINTTSDVSVPTPKMPKPNAFDYFLAAAKLEMRRDDVDNSLSAGPIYNYKLVNNNVQVTTSPAPHFTLAQKEELVRINGPALAKLRQGFAYPYMNPPLRSINALVPYFSKFRALARLLSLAGHVEEARGDWAGAANDYLDAVQMGEKIPHGGDSIGRLVGVACAAIGRKPLWKMADHLTASEARSATLRLETLSTEEDPLSDTFVQEKWSNQASLEELLKKPGYPASVLDTYTKSMLMTMPATARAIYLTEGRLTPKKKLMDDLTDYWDAQVRYAQQPNPMQAQEPALPADWLYLLQASAFPEAFEHFGKGIAFRTLDDQTENALLETSLALRAYKLDHGTYPQSLSELVPNDLQHVPTDPFSVGGRAPLRYRLTGKSFVLYSIGPDGIDNGGKPVIDHSIQGPAKFYPLMNSKGDIVAGVNF